MVLLVVDTLRADHLSDYGYQRATLGPVESFTREATRYSRAMAPASWTQPSVATIFSGLLPVRHRAKLDGSNRLNQLIPTLAEVLSAKGWETGGFSANVHVSRQTDFDQGFDTFLDHQGGVLGYPDIGTVMRLARSWLQAADPPFFLFLQPMNTHGPYRVPPEYQKLLLDRRPSDEFRYLEHPRTTLMEGVVGLREEIGDSYLDSLEDQYDTAIRYTMERIGRLFDDLRRLELWDDSLIILTADHGEELFDHGGFSHGYSLHREVLRVPLYVKLPGQRAGRVDDAPVSLADIYPTVLEAVGLPPARSLDGRSMLAPGASDRELIFEANSRKRCVARAILSGRHKLIRTVSDYQGRAGVVELFDTVADPMELLDLSAAEPELAARLEGRMDALFAELESRALPLPGERDAELDRDTLEALGYVQ